MKMYIFSALALAVAVRGVPMEMTTMETSTEVPVNHVSKYSARFTSEQVNGSIACSEQQKHIFFTDYWINLAHVCIDPELWGSEEGKQDPNCKFYCQGYSVGILDDTGHPSKAGYDQYLDLAIVSEDQRAKAKELIYECLETMADKIDINDPKCVGAGEFNKCIFRIFGIGC
jgi:hypothetical protein